MMCFEKSKVSLKNNTSIKITRNTRDLFCEFVTARFDDVLGKGFFC